MGRRGVKAPAPEGRPIDMTVAAAQLLVLNPCHLRLAWGAAFAARYSCGGGSDGSTRRRNMAPGGSACWCVPVWRRCGRCLLSVSYADDPATASSASCRRHVWLAVLLSWLVAAALLARASPGTIMSTFYRAVGWNRQKRRYDAAILIAVPLWSYLSVFVAGGFLIDTNATVETLIRFVPFGTRAARPCCCTSSWRSGPCAGSTRASCRCSTTAGTWA